MTIQKHLAQQINQKQNVTTNYGTISVPVKQNKNNSPNKGNIQKKKFQQSDQMMYEMRLQAGKNKKTSGQGVPQQQWKQEKQVYLQVNIDPQETKLDQFQPFNELAVSWGILEDEIMNPKKALALKKQQRQAQMERKREKLPVMAQIPILKNQKIKDSTKVPQILIQPSEARSPSVVNTSQDDPNKLVGEKGKANKSTAYMKSMTGKSKAKKQVSIKEDKKILLSPTVKDKNKMHKNKGTSSDANLGVKKLNSYVSGSEFTLSSIGKEDKDNDSNSIISEEDSAFDDCSPAQNKLLKQKRQEERGQTFAQEVEQVNKEEKGGIIGIQGNARNANISINTKPQAYRLDAKVVNRQKTTVGSKTKATDGKAPIQRSPTHKSRNGNQNFTSEEQKFKMQRVGGGQDKQKTRNAGPGGGRLSRNSSLNLPSEHQTDQLSVNFGKSRFIGGRKQSKGQNSQYETLSVQSIITKGGTVINPFSLKKDNSKKNVRSLSRFDDSHHNLKEQTLSKARLKEENSRSRFKDQPGDILKSNLKIGGDDLDEDLDLKKSMQKAKMKMMQVYLKAPYQVLTINEIKLKQRENYSPIKLFRAENNLVLHTVLRSNQHQTQKTTNNRLKLEEVGEEAQHLLKAGAFSATNLNKTHGNSKKAPSQMSEAHEGRNGRPNQQVPAGALAETEPSISNHLNASSKDNIVLSQTQQLSSYKLKQLKQQKLELEHNFKQVFYEQLHEQFDRKIEQVNLQNNLLKKQKDLFSCYGPSQAYSATLGAPAGANLPRLFNDGNFTHTGDLGQLEKAKSNWLANTNQTFNISEVNQIEEMQGRAHEKEGPQEESDPKANVLRIAQDHSHTLLSTINDEAEILKGLVDMSTTMGFSKRQMEKLRRQKQTLETAEKSLERHQNGPNKGQFPKPVQTTCGSFTVDDRILQMAQQYQTEKKISFYNQKVSYSPTKTTKMPPLVKKKDITTGEAYSPNLPSNRSQQSLSPTQVHISNPLGPSRNKFQGKTAGKHTSNVQSIDNSNVSEVKDYFTNKISLRRSIEHKLHYDSRSQNPKGGGTFRRQKHDSIPKKYSHNPYTSHRSKKGLDAAAVLDANDDLGEFGSPTMASPSQLTKGGGAGAITIHARTHVKTRTMAGPELTKHAGTLLPQIKGNYGSTNRSSNKKKGQDHLNELNDSHSDAACPEIKAKNDSTSFFFSPEGACFPLKKSGTHVEKDRQPIRQQKDKVIMAYAAQNLVVQRGGAQMNEKKQPHQLGYQYMNKSPRLEKSQNYPMLTPSGKLAANPELHQNSMQRFDVSGTDPYAADNPIIAEGGPTHGGRRAAHAKFVAGKQSLMLKGVLNQQRRQNKQSIGGSPGKKSQKAAAYSTVEMINNYSSRPRESPSKKVGQAGDHSLPSLPEIQPANSTGYVPVPGQ